MKLCKDCNHVVPARYGDYLCDLRINPVDGDPDIYCRQERKTSLKSHRSGGCGPDGIKFEPKLQKKRIVEIFAVKVGKIFSQNS